MRLIGTKGYISYNPVFAHRQFGYSILEAPTPIALIALARYYKDESVIEILCQIRSA